MSRIVRLMALTLTIPALLGAQGNQKKIRIAVLDFDYEGVRSQVEEMFGSNVDIGQGIADLVAAELGKSNRYEVAPREGVPAGERADAGAAGQAVARLGVDVVVMGSVLGYGKAEGQEAGVNLRVGRVGIGGIGRQRSIAAVSLSVQVLGPGGQPLLVAAGNGQATGSGTALLGNAKVGGLSVGGRVNLSGDDYRNSTIGQATTQAVSDLAKGIESGYQSVLRGLTLAAPVAAPAPAPMPQPAPTAAPVPAAYGAPIAGPFVWGMYQFKGTEHFRYTATQTDEDGKKDGWYTLDAAPAANGMFQLTVAGALGTDSFRSSSTVQPGQGIPMMQLAAMGPGALVLFSPMYMFFGGQQWSVGNEWTFTQDGETVSFKVESTCSYAGVSGLRGVWRQNNETRLDMCVSPNVALPLAVTMLDEDGESYQLTLVEFTP